MNVIAKIINKYRQFRVRKLEASIESTNVEAWRKHCEIRYEYTPLMTVNLSMAELRALLRNYGDDEVSDIVERASADLDYRRMYSRCTKIKSESDDPRITQIRSDIEKLCAYKYDVSAKHSREFAKCQLDVLRRRNSFEAKYDVIRNRIAAQIRELDEIKLLLRISGSESAASANRRPPQKSVPL